jgi:hypothetical protein
MIESFPLDHGKIIGRDGRVPAGIGFQIVAQIGAVQKLFCFMVSRRVMALNRVHFRRVGRRKDAVINGTAREADGDQSEDGQDEYWDFHLLIF